MTTEHRPDEFAEANKNFFDELAPKYDDLPHAVERARITATSMRKFYNFDENTTTVMDYACGTGLISRELSPYVKRIVGVDISQGMVDQYNLRTFNQGIPKEEMQAFCTKLEGEPGELGEERFDVIVCVAAYHHFTSIEDVTRTLVYFLKPEGALMVVDRAKQDGPHSGDKPEYEHEHDHGHGHHHTIKIEHIVPHRGGLAEAVVQKAFEGAGLKSFSFEMINDTAKGNNKLFLAMGLKPGA